MSILDCHSLVDVAGEVFRHAEDHLMQVLKEGLVRHLGHLPTLEEAREHCVHKLYDGMSMSFFCWDDKPFLAVIKDEPKVELDGNVLRFYSYRYAFVDPLPEECEGT